MSEIRVRRSGLVAFGIRLGSTLTGLAFVVLVTSNLSQEEFGIWQLIGRTIAYAVFVNVIIGFWSTRYRARGIKVGKSILSASLIFSAIVIPVYVIASIFVAGSVSQATSNETNLFFFLLSSPQVLLLTLILVPESILWGYKPEMASIGFGVFEVVKVGIAAFTVAVLHLSLTGAILAVIGAEIAQLTAAFVFSRGEYSDRLSFKLISNMVRTGWLAILNNAHPLVITLDFLIVASLTHSPIPIALYGAALVFAGIITYSGWIASGLYVSTLSGKDPRQSTKQVFELQLVFILPMTIGAIILAPSLMHLLNPVYTEGYQILQILAISSALTAISTTLDSIISGADATDISDKADFSLYLRSKLFLLAKINLALATGYLITIGLIANLLQPSGSSAYVTLGVLWATSSLGMSVIGLALKSYYSRGIARLSISQRTIRALSIASVAFGLVLYYLQRFVLSPQGGELQQAGSLLLIGFAALLVYALLVLALSDSVRQVSRTAVSSLIRV